MKYMGSKNRIAKYLLPIILKDRKPDQYYVEPFCGGCNMIDKVDGLRIANDSHFYLIEMFKAIQKGWVPPDYVSLEEWVEIKNNISNYPPFYAGFVGFGCSFLSNWFSSYARNVNQNKPNAEILNKTTKSYCRQSKNNILKQSQNLNGVLFSNISYLDMDIPDNSIIYCDPPYRGTSEYKDKFDHETFWEWCRIMSEYNTVFVSEYNAPQDFECIYEISIKAPSDSTRKVNKQAIEKLFIYNKNV